MGRHLFCLWVLVIEVVVVDVAEEEEEEEEEEVVVVVVVVGGGVGVVVGAAVGAAAGAVAVAVERGWEGFLFCFPCLYNNFLLAYRLVWNFQGGSYLLSLSPAVYQCFPLGSWRALSVFAFYCFSPRSFFPRSFVHLPICYCHSGLCCFLFSYFFMFYPTPYF